MSETESVWTFALVSSNWKSTTPCELWVAETRGAKERHAEHGVCCPVGVAGSPVKPQMRVRVRLRRELPQEEHQREQRVCSK